MNLEAIVLQQAEYSWNSGIIVEFSRSPSWVSISAPGSDGVFLQGWEADKFIDRLDKLAESLPHIDYETLELSQAYDYADLLAES